jgi:hypothetical protein
MGLEWLVRETAAIAGRRFPSRSLLIQLGLRWQDEESIEVSSAELWVTIENLKLELLPWQVVPLRPEVVHQGREVSLTVQVPIGGNGIRMIEESRVGETELRLKVSGRVHHRVVNEQTINSATPDRSPGYEGIRVRGLAGPLSQQFSQTIRLPRDEWHRVLKELAWDQFLIFEVPVLQLKRPEEFVRALELLAQAQDAHRNGAWDRTVTEARRAIEAAAHVVSDADEDRKRAFLTLNRELFPNDRDKPKRDMLDHLMLGLAAIRHVGAHGFFDTQIRREDAEVALTVAISVMRYMGETLSQRNQSGE